MFNMFYILTNRKHKNNIPTLYTFHLQFNLLHNWCIFCSYPKNIFRPISIIKIHITLLSKVSLLLLKKKSSILTSIENPPKLSLYSKLILKFSSSFRWINFSLPKKSHTTFYNKLMMINYIIKYENNMLMLFNISCLRINVALLFQKGHFLLKYLLQNNIVHQFNQFFSHLSSTNLFFFSSTDLTCPDSNILNVFWMSAQNFATSY